MTDPQILLSEAKCFLCLGISLEESVKLALLDRIFTGKYVIEVNTNDLSTNDSDPNVAGLIPPDPNAASTFYQDPSTPGAIFNVWRWSKNNQTWVQFSSP